jgi:hypothetical protein
MADPGVSPGALASVVEGAREGGGATASEQALGAAPTSIDHKRAIAESKPVSDREQARATQTTSRNEGRLTKRENGELVDRADWTEDVLRRWFGMRGRGAARRAQRAQAGAGHRRAQADQPLGSADRAAPPGRLPPPCCRRETSRRTPYSRRFRRSPVVAVSGRAGRRPTPSTRSRSARPTSTASTSSTRCHEVGHGVHAQIPGPVNSWLQNDMQFWFTDWDTWIQELGGYPQKFWHPSGQWVNVDDAWKGALRSIVENFTGTSSWTPARATPEAGQHPDLVAAWQAMPAAIKNACQQSTPYWYDNYRNFQAANGKRYFLNHWYKRPFTIGNKAFSTVAATNDTYTAMSEKEFFANCYAEYFNDPAGVHDQSKWGGTLPADVKAFFKTCIVHRHPYTTFQKNQREAPAK